MKRTFELMRMALPAREDKRRVARALGLKSEALIYKWCEDPDGSGRPNLIDKLDVILDHARVHHPHAALAIEQHISAGNALAFGRIETGSARELVLRVQPGVEKEVTEAVQAFTRALRQLAADQQTDLRLLLKEVQDAERELGRTAVMIRALIQAEEEAAGDH